MHMPYAIDLHTHSVASPDGSLTTEDYRSIIQQGRLQYIAVTDHNTVDFALQLHAELGDQIIVGEEITTGEGELIGLYISQTIPPTATATEAVRAIKAQGGLVYVPHPFETVRNGLTPEALQRIARDVDIIEVHNGRAMFQNFSKDALLWGQTHSVPGAASSDAHGRIGWGRTCSIIEKTPTRDTLTGLLGFAQLNRGFVGARGLLYPKINRIRKRFNGA
jgi:predicted metal-dependent phosphoesterase TrpH